MASRSIAPPKPKTTTSNHIVSLTEHRLLEALERFGYLSARQLTDLLFGKSLTFVQAHLKILREEGYVCPIPLSRHSLGGRPLYLYTPTDLGYSYLRVRRKTMRRQPHTLYHTIDANELLVQAHHLTRLDPSFTVLGYRTEQELKRKLTGEVVPDGWVHLRRGDKGWPILFEVDRDTEERDVIRSKVAALMRFCEEGGGYEEAFGLREVVVAVVVTVDAPHRVDQLIRWCQAELKEQGAEDWAPLFFFTQKDLYTKRPNVGVVKKDGNAPTEIDPRELFCAPIWRQPFSEQLVGLVNSSISRG